MSWTANGCRNCTAWTCRGSSFRATGAIAALRAYLRHHETLAQCATTNIQRMQKALVQTNLQLPVVISDITGVTGLFDVYQQQSAVCYLAIQGHRPYANRRDASAGRPPCPRAARARNRATMSRASRFAPRSTT